MQRRERRVEFGLCLFAIVRWLDRNFEESEKVPKWWQKPCYPLIWIKLCECKMWSKQENFIFHKDRKDYKTKYILGVLTHTTALDRLWGGDETLTMWF